MSARVFPVTRAGDPKAHLRTLDDPYALCGRPAGKQGWSRVEGVPDTKSRCRECTIAGRLINTRPAVPVYPWNPRL